MYVVWRLSSILFACAFTFMSVIGFSDFAFAANEAPQSFTYQGRFMNGAVPLAGTFDIKFEIYAPGGACLLYQEVDPGINLTTSNGNVAIAVGYLVGVNYAGAVPG